MKNKAYQFTLMSEEERSMTLFYTIEGMIETLELIGREMDTEDTHGSSRLAVIAHIEEQIENLYSRVNRDYILKKTKEAINYAI
jgi:hypothetical protein